jgi:hypothetical protein
VEKNAANYGKDFFPEITLRLAVFYVNLQAERDSHDNSYRREVYAALPAAGQMRTAEREAQPHGGGGDSARP